MSDREGERERFGTSILTASFFFFLTSDPPKSKEGMHGAEENRS